jgi:probable rRNA maturation factor
MKIHIYNRQKDLPLSKPSAKDLVRSALDHLSTPCEEIAVYFVSEKKIGELHTEFFDDPTSTDCISFPLDSRHLGEIFVCPKAALRYVQKKKGSPYIETSLYVIHGLLHLLGYDDLEPKKREAMRKKEKSCMAHLERTNTLIHA